MRITKILALPVCASLLLLCAGGCSSEKHESRKKHIVATIFPEYDWTREIIGSSADNTELTLLLSNGVDMHSYQPSVDDIMTISSCDMFIYVGGESDTWVKAALEQATNKDMIVISLMDILGDKAKEEETVSGMQTEAEHEDTEEKEYDEHVWMSLENAELFCDEITKGLTKLDSANAEQYKTNCGEYKKKLGTLCEEYRTAADASEQRTIIVGDRFPFRYLTDEFGIKYYAAFPGCSAETEASFETIVFLANKADEIGAKAIIQTESPVGSVAETIRDNTKSKDQQIVTLDSMQSVSAKDIDEGATYISLMEKNLQSLRRAL